MPVYQGIWDNDKWFLVFKDGQPFTADESLQHVNHSPDGFSWGYGGSGPSQLAFALLLDVMGLDFAKKHYMDFKWLVIAALPKEWAMTAEDITKKCTEIVGKEVGRGTCRTPEA